MSFEFSVATFNILHPRYSELTAEQNKAPDRWTHMQGNQFVTNWPKRKEKVASVIKASDADIVCLQEISDQSLKDLQKCNTSLSDYDYFHFPYRNKPDGIAILFKKIAFKTLDACIPFPKAEHRYNKKGKDYIVRFPTMLFEHIATQKKVAVTTGHIQLYTGGNDDLAALKEQINLLLNSSLQANNDVDCRVICGDFNMTTEHRAIKETDLVNFVKSHDILGKIDHIFLYNSFGATLEKREKHIFEEIQDPDASDHNLIKCAYRFNVIPQAPEYVSVPIPPPSPQNRQQNPPPPQITNQPPVTAPTITPVRNNKRLSLLQRIFALLRRLFCCGKG